MPTVACAAGRGHPRVVERQLCGPRLRSRRVRRNRNPRSCCACGKGRIDTGMDADLVALDANGAAHHVWLGGIAHVQAGDVVRRGMFEG